MKFILRIILMLFLPLVALLQGCTKTETLNPVDPLGLGGDKVTATQIDKWIYDTLTTPYNIEVKYRFDEFETALDRTLIPPREEQVIPILQVLKNAFMTPFLTEGGNAFLKTNVPKQIVLIGSPSYNSNGSITLGEAEGGKKILLYNVNEFNASNSDDVKQVLRTMQHEFAHILNQKAVWPVAFNLITNSDYTADWTNQPPAKAYARGFISTYARSAYGEDWAEMVATMLAEGKAGFDDIVNEADVQSKAQGLPSATAKLRQKEALVVAYYKNVWNIDLYALQQLVSDAREATAPTPFLPLYKIFGDGNKYSSLNIHRNQQTSAEFAALYDRTADSLKFKVFNLILDSLVISKPSSDTVLLQVRFLTSNGETAYKANFRYKVNTAVNGDMTFGPVLIQPARGDFESNANIIKNGVKPLTDFFTQSVLALDYKGGKPNTNLAVQKGVLKVVGNEPYYILGLVK